MDTVHQSHRYCFSAIDMICFLSTDMPMILEDNDKVFKKEQLRNQ